MIRWFFRTSDHFQPSPIQALGSYLILGVWTLIVLFPLYWLFTTSFKLPIDVASGPKYIPFVDFQPSLHAWNEMLVENGAGFVLRPYYNTITTGVISALAALAIGSLAAYALTRFEYRPKPGLIFTFALCVALMILLIALGIPWQLAVAVGLVVYFLLAQGIGRRFKGTMENSDIAFWLISQRILPPVTVIIPVYILFQQLGMLDTLPALIISYCAANLPIVIWFMRDYFQSIPFELEESAFIDGASRYQVLWRIVLPLSVPGLIATFLIVLVFCWNEYLMALFLTGAQTQTMPILVSAQNGVRGPQWWNMSVLVMLMVGPLILMAILLERYIAKGLLVGAVKGYKRMSEQHFLVTGALGCIGAWVVRNLVQAGVTTTIYDLGSDLKRLRLIMTEEEVGRIGFAEGGDVTNLEMLKRAFEQHNVTHVIHLAALQVPFCRANPPLGAQVNVTGTVNVFEAARHVGIKRVVYASSIAVYGPRENYPPGLLAPDARLDPRSHYGVYKQANEASGRVYYAETGISSIGLRPYTVYGPGRDQGMTSAPTSAMLAAARGEGFHIPFGGVSGYQHADDVAKLFVKAAYVAFEGAGGFNLKGEIAPMSEVVAHIERAAPEVAGKITFDDVPLPFPDGFDDSELVKLMGTVPSRSLEQGIAATVEHFRQAVAAESRGSA